MSQSIQILNRVGELIHFDENKIFKAIEKAFLSENRIIPDVVSSLTNDVVQTIHLKKDLSLNIELIQDTVEDKLSDSILNGELGPADTAVIDVDDEGINVLIESPLPTTSPAG